MKNIKSTYIIGLLLLGMAMALKAQINTPYNLYFEELYVINPGAAINNDFYSASLMTHLANTGFENAPRTTALSLNGPITAKAGIGLRVINDARGAFSDNSILGSYAYKINLGSEGHLLNLGLSAGIYWQKFDVGTIDAIDMDDPVMEASYYNKKHFMNELGVFYRWNDLRAGVSAPYLAQLGHHYIAYADYHYLIPNLEELELFPMLLYQHLPEKAHQLDASLKVKYKPVWISYTYRTNNNMMFALGAEYKNYRIAYAFELNNDELSHIAAGSHEIMLSYRFNLDLSPKNASYKKDKMPWQEE